MCDRLWALGVKTVCLQLPNIQSKSASNISRGGGSQMRGQPVSGGSTAQCFQKGPLKTANGHRSFNHVQSTKRRTFQFLKSQRGTISRCHQRSVWPLLPPPAPTPEQWEAGLASGGGRLNAQRESGTQTPHICHQPQASSRAQAGRRGKALTFYEVPSCCCCCYT